MSVLKPASWSYAEEFVPEPEVVEGARRRGIEFGDAAPVGTGAGAVLRFVAAAVQARHVVEIGTGAGTSGPVCRPVFQNASDAAVAISAGSSP